MKHIKPWALALVAGVLLAGCAAYQGASPEMKTHVHIRTYEGKSKAELFKAVLNHFTLSVRSANDAIQMKDPEQGRVVMNILFPSAFASDGLGVIHADIRCSVIADVKDGKVRYEYMNIEGFQDGRHAAGLDDRASLHEGLEKAGKDLEDGLTFTAQQKDW